MSDPVKIMISSTRADLMEYRNRASELIARLKDEKQGRQEIIEISMEVATQSGRREYPVALSKEWVEEALWVIVIVGWHYGTITDEDGADGIGVTEWEYRHAMALQKKVFVFLSGEPDTANAYRPAANESNLSDWFIKQSEDQLRKIKEFRKQIGTRYADFFRDIDGFTRQLERALRKALDDLLPPIREGGGLATLILECKPAFLVFMNSIRSLNHYKNIHDALHELRQFVIKPIRERILPVWYRDGELSRRNERRLSDIREAANRYLQEIADSCGQLDAAKAVDLIEDIAKLERLASGMRPYDDADSDEATLPDYTERVDQFAEATEAAFSCANKRMLTEQEAFSNFHDALTGKLNTARDESRLGPGENRTLQEELRKLQEGRKRLVDALIIHSTWQELHDDMERVQGHRGTNRYARKLSDFVEDNKGKIGRLVSESPRNLEAHPDLDTVILECLAALRTALDAVGATVDEERFDRLRAAFDNSFYQVDKRVLAIVQRSLGRVEQLDKLFYELAIPNDA